MCNELESKGNKNADNQCNEWNVVVKSVTCHDVTLQWTTASPDVEVYKIEKHHKYKGWRKVGWTNRNECTVGNLEPNFGYKLRVKALKGDDSRECYKELFVENIVICTQLSLPSTTELYRAIRNNQKFLVKRLLRSYPQLIDYPGPNGYLPLANAIVHGNRSVVDILLASGASVRLGNLDNHRTPLHQAFHYGDLPLARILLNQGANMEAKDILGLTPCHMAIDSNQDEILKFALKNGANIGATDGCGWTLLMRAELVVGLFQLPVVNDVATNVAEAVKAISDAKEQNPNLQLAVLPESFNAPYGIEYFSKYAEQIPEGFTSQQLSQLARRLSIYIVGGSIIERVKPDKLYNTCAIWSPTGKLIGRHRKVHLFHIDIDIENDGGAFFNEAVALTAGNELTVVDIAGRKVGFGICHDKRFEEMARAYRNLGCEMLIYPSAFCICQGPMHWELLQRARATDNQVFVMTCAPARDNRAKGYVAYGHSMIVNPWGQVQCEAGATRQVIIAEIDFQLMDDVRRQIPIFSQRRLDIYNKQLMSK